MATTPNTNIQLPTPGADEGTWGTELNAAFDTIDAHDHSPGKGAKVPATGLNINGDLDIQNNTLTNLSKIQFKSKSAVQAGTANQGSIQEINGDLFWVNGNGVAVQITTGAALAPVTVTATYNVGMIFAFSGPVAPAGFMLCDGTAIDRTAYNALFALIGTAYGVGDGTNTFNLPDLRGRAPIMAGTYTDSVSGTVTRTLGQKIGAEAHVLTTAQMPSHNHTTGSDGAHVHSTNYSEDTPGFSDGRPVANNNNGGRPVTQYNSNTAGAHTHVISNTGGDTAHNNMQPSLAVTYIIKT